jgi:hypothetical protein
MMVDGRGRHAHRRRASGAVDDYYGDAPNLIGNQIPRHHYSGPAKSAPEPFATSGRPSATLDQSVHQRSLTGSLWTKASRELSRDLRLNADGVKVAYAQAPQTSVMAF